MIKPSETEQPVRIDKWLWAARFYKTRTVAADAISGGKVHVNGERVKPSRSIKVGDYLEIRRGHYEFCVTVISLGKQRRPASEAGLMYEETAQSVEARRVMQDHLKIEAVYTRKTNHRPNKQERRQLLKVKRGTSS